MTLNAIICGSISSDTKQLCAKTPRRPEHAARGSGKNPHPPAGIRRTQCGRRGERHALQQVKDTHGEYEALIGALIVIKMRLCFALFMVFAVNVSCWLHRIPRCAATVETYNSNNEYPAPVPEFPTLAAQFFRKDYCETTESTETQRKTNFVSVNSVSFVVDLNRTRMTRIGRIFTDLLFFIRVHPCHPCNPCCVPRSTRRK